MYARRRFGQTERGVRPTQPWCCGCAHEIETVLVSPCEDQDHQAQHVDLFGAKSCVAIRG